MARIRSYILLRIVVEYDEGEVTDDDLSDYTDRVLDNGAFQDALTAYAEDMHGKTIEVVQSDVADVDTETEPEPERHAPKGDGNGPLVCCTCSTPLTETEIHLPRNAGHSDEICDACVAKETES